MRPTVRSAFLGFTGGFEGVIPFAYLDVLGLVTIAYGNLIDPLPHALPLPFVRKSSGAHATRDEIAREWAWVKRCACGVYGPDASRCAWAGKRAPDDARPCLAHLGHRAAEHVTSLRLPDDGVRYVALAKLDELASALERRFPAWDTWPADAQLATLSMAWACGAAFRFPRLSAALAAQDWVAAARECTIREAGNPGVVPRNRANRVLYRNAAAVARGVPELDPAELYWPESLPDVTPTVRELPNPPSAPTVVVELPPVREELPAVRDDVRDELPPIGAPDLAQGAPDLGATRAPGDPRK